MKYNSVTGKVLPEEELKADYAQAREIGSVNIGNQALFFRKMRKIYYIPYEEMSRCFRRVLKVNMKFCCGGGDMAVENLIVCTPEGELAQIPLPDTRSARAVMEELGRRAPQVPQGVQSQEKSE